MNMKNIIKILFCSVVYCSLAFGQLGNNPTVQSITATKALISDTVKAKTTFQKFASKTVFLNTFDFKESGVFRDQVVLQDTVTLTNAAVYYPTFVEVRKPFYLFERGGPFISPALIFKQYNDVSLGYDSAIISFDNPGTTGKAVKFSTPIEFGSVNSADLAGVNQVLTMNGDTIITKGSSGAISRMLPYGASIDQGLKWTGSYWAPGTFAVGGGGGALSPMKFRRADLSFSSYPDSIASFGTDFRLTDDTGRGVIINLAQGIKATDSPLFANLSIGNSGAVGINSGTGTTAFLRYPTGADSPFFNFPNLSGTFTVAMLNGGQTFTSGIWNAGAVTSTGPITNTGVGSNLVIAGTGTSTIAGGLSVTGALSSGNFNAIGSVTGRSYTLQNPSFTGATTITQTDNDNIKFTNGGYISFDTPYLLFPKGVFGMQWVVNTLTANRSITIPNNTGTMAVSATAPLVLSLDGTLSVTGGIITTLNGLTAGTQTFSVGTAGTAPNIVSAVANHAFNFPLAGATVTSGTVSNTTQTIAGDKTFNSVTRLLNRAIATLQVFTVGATSLSGFPVAERFEFVPISGAQVANLPAIVNAQLRHYIINRTSPTGSNTVTIVPSGVETINDASSVVLSRNGDFLDITNSSGTDWQVYAGRIAGVNYFNTVYGGTVWDDVTVLAGVDSVFKSVTGMVAGGYIMCSMSEPATSSLSPLGVPNIVMVTNGYFIKTYSPQSVPVHFNVQYKKNW